MGLFKRKPKEVKSSEVKSAAASISSSKTYDISDMGGLEMRCLTEGLDLITKSGIGDQYNGLYAAVKTGKLTRAQLKECGAFAAWYRDVVASQPNLAETFNAVTYDAVIKALGSVADYCNKKLNG